MYGRRGGAGHKAGVYFLCLQALIIPLHSSMKDRALKVFGVLHQAAGSDLWSFGCQQFLLGDLLLAMRL